MGANAQVAREVRARSSQCLRVMGMEVAAGASIRIGHGEKRATMVLLAYAWGVDDLAPGLASFTGPSGGFRARSSTPQIERT